MNEPSGGFDYYRMKAELQELRQKLEEMKMMQAATMSGAHGSARARFPRAPMIAACLLAAMLAGSGVLWSDPIKALFVDPSGKVGIATVKPEATLDVDGDAKVRKGLTVDGKLTAGSVETASLDTSGQVRGGTLKTDGKAEMQDATIHGKATITTLEGNPMPPPAGGDNVWRQNLTILGDVQLNGALHARNTTGLINGKPDSIAFNFYYKAPTRDKAVDIRPICQNQEGCTVRLEMKNDNDTLKVDWYHIDLNRDGSGTTTNYKGGKNGWRLNLISVPSTDDQRVIPYKYDWCLADTRGSNDQVYFYCVNTVTARIEISKE